jgi:hypothetical protein
METPSYSWRGFRGVGKRTQLLAFLKKQAEHMGLSFELRMNTWYLNKPVNNADPEEEDDDVSNLKGLTWFKTSDKDGTNWLVPELVKADGTATWRVITEDAAGTGQAEVNGFQAALGYGPAVVTRAAFNARMRDRGLL